MAKGVSTRKVGRPKKVDRDAAVFIARWWRTSCLGESVQDADDWIIEHWANYTPIGQRSGITEAAHVRAAVRRARCTWLGAKGSDGHEFTRFMCNAGLRLSADSIQVVDPSQTDWQAADALPSDFEIDGCAIAAIEFVLHDRPKWWLWMPGMTAARRGWLVPLAPPQSTGDGPSHMSMQGRTPVAVGIAEFVGLLRLGRLERFHAPQNSWRFG